MFELVFAFFLMGTEPLVVNMPGYPTMEACMQAGSENEHQAVMIAIEIEASDVVWLCHEVGEPT